MLVNVLRSIHKNSGIKFTSKTTRQYNKISNTCYQLLPQRFHFSYSVTHNKGNSLSVSVRIHVWIAKIYRRLGSFLVSWTYTLPGNNKDNQGKSFISNNYPRAFEHFTWLLEKLLKTFLPDTLLVILSLKCRINK